MSGLIGLGVLTVALGPAFGLALILPPGLVPHFFAGGAAGVYGNATGGRRGAALGGLVNGLLITFLPALLLKVLGAFGDENTTFGDTDFSWFGILVGTSAGLGGGVGLVLVAVIGAALLFAAIQMQRKVVATGWDPAPGRGVPPRRVPSPGRETRRPAPRSGTPSRRRRARRFPAAARGVAGRRVRPGAGPRPCRVNVCAPLQNRTLVRASATGRPPAAASSS